MAIGYRKLLRQSYLRMLKQPGSPEMVARGVAVGFFVAFFIPFSLQMLIAFPLAWAVRGARVPAILCTWVSNPLTIPFLYPLQCLVGSYVIGMPLSRESTHAFVADIIESPSITMLLGLGRELVLSFLVGGFIFGLVAVLIGYPIAVRLVVRYRVQLAIRREKRLARVTRRLKEKRGYSDETC